MKGEHLRRELGREGAEHRVSMEVFTAPRPPASRRLSTGSAGSAAPAESPPAGKGVGQVSGRKQAVKRHHHKHNLKHRYEFLETLGKGTYGKVKKARERSGRLVAIKSIRKEKIKDEQDLVHIRREIEIMSTLCHPHIITIYEVFENKDKIVIVMEYASRGDLYDYICDKRNISEREARHFFRQIVSAVHYCHQTEDETILESCRAKLQQHDLSVTERLTLFKYHVCSTSLKQRRRVEEETALTAPDCDQDRYLARAEGGSAHQLFRQQH